MALNKLQIRAKMLPVLSELKSDVRLSYEVFIEKTQEFHEIDDHKTSLISWYVFRS